MREILLVGAGGFVGSVCRDLASCCVVGHVVLGLAAVWLGDRLGRGL